MDWKKSQAVKIIFVILVALFLSQFLINNIYVKYTPRPSVDLLKQRTGDFLASVSNGLKKITSVTTSLLTVKVEKKPTPTPDKDGGEVVFGDKPTTTPIPSLLPSPVVSPTVNTSPTPVVTKAIPTVVPTRIPTATITPKPTSVPLPTATPMPTQPENELDQMIAQYSNLPYTQGYTGTPKTCRQVLNFSGNNSYSYPYRNSDCRVTKDDMDRAYARMKTYYPAYWPNTKLLDQWEIVQEGAIKYHFNPIFVISLWIEESAAGGATSATPFGCDYLRNPDGSYTTLKGRDFSIYKQMTCLFVSYACDPANFGRFACRWQFGSEYYNESANTCNSSPSFTKSLNFWLDFLSSGKPGECQTKYCPNAPGC
ncbi:hypothetical protein GYA28_01410 [Candidatus Roizmanbacteria bacterium]|nr:hypothetical protein [Candidatus Roizmanbacteria bacterium]